MSGKTPSRRRMTLRVCRSVLCVLLLTGCSGEPNNAPLSPNSGAERLDGGARADASSDFKGPVVSVLSHREPGSVAGTHSLSSDTIVIEESVSVRCLAKPNPSSGVPIDPASVRVSISDGVHAVETAAIPTGENHEFEGTLSISDFDNGAIAIWCRATESGDAQLGGSAMVLTFLDLGPTIEILSPLPVATYGDLMSISFIVRQGAVVAHGHLGFAPQDVELFIGNRNVHISNTTMTPVGDGFQFEMVWSFEEDGGIGPGGVTTLTVTAANRRFPMPSTRSTTVSFFVGE